MSSGLQNTGGFQNTRKGKILSFVEKDLFIINNYESAPFKNPNHAIECLIPYHVFQVMAEDVKFKGSDVMIDLKKECAVLEAKIEKMVEDSAFMDDSFTPQLLLYHEQRFINTMVQQAQEKEAKLAERRKELVIRIQKASNLHVYGGPFNIRIKHRK